MAAVPRDLAAKDGCKNAEMVFACEVPLTEVEKRVWPSGDWVSLDLQRSSATFKVFFCFFDVVA